MCLHSVLCRQTAPGYSESLGAMPLSPLSVRKCCWLFLSCQKTHCSYVMLSGAKRLNWGRKDRNLKRQLFVLKSEASRISSRNVCNNHYLLIFKF